MTGVWRSSAGEGSPARGGREREIFSTTGRYLQLSAGTLPSINGSSQPPPAATVTATTANTQPDVTSHSSTLSVTSSSSRTESTAAPGCCSQVLMRVAPEFVIATVSAAARGAAAAAAVTPCRLLVCHNIRLVGWSFGEAEFRADVGSAMITDILFICSL